MSKATSNFRTAPLLLALAMALPVLSFAIPAEAFPIHPTQKDDIVANEGGGAPYGRWQIANETTTMYIYGGSAGPGPYQQQTVPGCEPVRGVEGLVPPPPGTGINPGSPCPILEGDLSYFRYGSVPNDQQGDAAGSSGFSSHEGSPVLLGPEDLFQAHPAIGMQVKDDVTILRFEARVYAQSSNPDAALSMTIFRVASDDPAEREKYTGVTPTGDDRPAPRECMDNMAPPTDPPRTKKADPADQFDDFPITLRLTAVGRGSGAGSSIVPYEGSTDGIPEFGLTPPTLGRGEMLCVLIRAVGTSDTTILDLGRYGRESFVRMTADSARVNLWTEDRLGTVTDALPSARSSVESQRRVNIHAAVAAPFGAQECINNASYGYRPLPPPNQDADNCELDTLDQNKLRIAIRNKTPGSASYNKYLCLDQGRGFQCDDPTSNALYSTYVECCSSSEMPVEAHIADARPIKYFRWCPGGTCDADPGTTDNGIAKLEYTFRYGSEFKDGVYEVDLYHKDKLWHARKVFTVGGTEWTFDMAPGERPGERPQVDSTHRVALGETTEFHVRLSNNGAGSGTFGVTVPTPGDGWKATVSPSTVTLLPKQHQDFVVTVTPPPIGSADSFAGKIKVVSVAAVSIEDNSVKTRYLDTILTGERTSSVEIIPAVNRIEIRPSQLVQFPVTVRNNGTIRDTFLVTSAGLPVTDPASGILETGWSATANPAFVDIFAASREEVLMSVRAPEEAVPGDTFLLELRAEQVANRLISDSAFIPVLVKVVDRFHAVTYCAKNTGTYDDFGADDPEEGDVVDQVESLPDSDPLMAADRCSIEARYTDRGTSTANANWPMCWEVPPGPGTKSYNCERNIDTAYPFRIRVANTGDRDDRYVITAAWERIPAPDAHAGTDGVNPRDDDVANCDGTTRDGVPDGWRYRILDDGTSDTPTTVARIDAEDNLLPSGDSNRFALPARLGTDVGQKNGGGTAARTNPAGYYGFSGERVLGELRLEEKESQDVYVELGWFRPYIVAGDNNSPIGTSCPVNRFQLETPSGLDSLSGPCGPDASTTYCRNLYHPADDAQLRVTIRSANDPVLRDVQYLKVKLEPLPAASGSRVPGAFPGADVEVGLDDGKEVTYSVQEKGENIYLVRGINTGNMVQDFSFDVKAAKPGWTHTILSSRVIPSYVSGVQPGGTQDPGYNRYAPTGVAFPAANFDATNAYGPDRRGCQPSGASGTTVYCRNLGVFDEAQLEVRVKPPTNARVGDVDVLDVTFSGIASAGCESRPDATACRDGTDSIQIRTRVAGSFFFELEDLAGERLAYEGQSIAFPFSIHNEGGEPDVYQVSIDYGANGSDSNKTWKPYLGTGPLVAVPAGRSFHGFLGALVPRELQAVEVNGACTTIKEHFRIRVEGTRAPATKQSAVLDFFAAVDPCETEPFTLEAGMPGTRPARPVQIRSGGRASVEVTAVDTREDLQYMMYKINPEEQPETLPRGYTLECLATDPALSCTDPYRDFRAFTPNSEAIGDFHFVAPAGELGASRVVARIKAEGRESATTAVDEYRLNYIDSVLSLSSVYGITLEADPDPEGAFKVIPVGDPTSGNGVTFKVNVVNTGLTAQNVRLTTTAPPGGWTVTLPTTAAAGVFVQPGQATPIDVTLHAPVDAVVGNEAVLLLVGTVQEDTTKVSQLRLTARVGRFDFRVTADQEAVFPACPDSYLETTTIVTSCAAPGETATFQLRATNGADATVAVPDYARLRLDFNPAFRDLVEVAWGSECDSLETDPRTGKDMCILGGPHPVTKSLERLFDPAEVRTATVRVTLPDQILSKQEIPFNVVVESGLSPAPVFAQTALKAYVLPHRAADIDGDSLLEYAIDRDGDVIANREGGNGFEEFRENLGAGGQDTRLANMAAFLSPEAALRVANLTMPFNDPTRVDIAGCGKKGDGRVDFFLDTTQDGTPEVLWMPANGRFVRLNLTKDVNGDGVREYFYDADPDQPGLDGWYDLVQHRDGCLLAFYFDGDDIYDYVVDLDGDRAVDDGEPVLIGAADGISIRKIVQMLDMNGDGCRDVVTDANADGKVDNFVPAVKSGDSCDIVAGTSSIPVTLKDVTGDGVEDYTYPADGDGRPDSYYDPATGDSGFIDTQAAFVRELRSHIWLLGLFAFVLVLFVILLVVTRK